ncbi:uncharacterized protein TRAVEDRAFT_20847 [Trametes versicolor FP-101664 SS1]|uniref:uncharacterized protein n=1 Tax=Trametes versicolor (strain FP-101664) TaxID=717944 RepID=UPI0004621C5C|nr:uncharacterized protein TRAVEDRAFT_20847 [Trametes versicolor FP-101664 SS1]EIW57139.1 hypothetical protein TRAVEDRAFT_20847 [Trametes versicolor FP-101664 SS1]
MERRKSHSNIGVGKMILDILPRKVDVDSEKKLARHPIIVQPKPIVASLPSVHLPPSSSQPGETSFPRVVVVNPTPHPTPPATPHLSHPPNLTAAAHTSTHLLPPLPARSLVSATIVPMPASSQQSVPPTAAPTPQPLAASSSTSKQPSASAGQTASKTKAFNDETLKASDRRFFLQDTGSPEVESPERAPLNSSETKPQSPSSVTSSHAKSEVAGPSAAAAKRPRVQVRKSKERHVPVRPALQRLHSHGVRQASQQKKASAPEPKKAAFNIGSTSSNGSRGGPSTKAPSQNGDAVVRTRPSSPAPPAKQAPPPQASTSRAGPSQQRRGIMISTSSEYDTTDTENDSDWASEADSGEERSKAKKGKTKAQAAEEARLRVAAEEAQRQRDMFAKVPKRSYSNLNRAPSGLLSQLLNPDPGIFPPNHPYRSTRSTQDMSHLARQAPASKLQMSKSSVAVPLAAQVTAQAPVTPAEPAVRPGGGYRLKGRPQEEELEDTESEDENPDDTIQVSRSLAQQKLAALADPNRRRSSDRGGLLSQQKPQQHQHLPQHPHPQMQQRGERSGLTAVASAPIPLNHPYNLPPPAPPMTPRTTRRQMLQTELSESLRRNLLWERQVSNRKPRGVLGNALRPMTSMNGDGPAAAQQPPASKRASTGDPQVQGQFQGQQLNTEDHAERRRAAMARNRSWADDYHYSGW